jgi:3-isopropylmalate dehydratase small subunit
LGVSAFYELRFSPDGSEKPDFVLNKPQFRTASVLVAGDNFGCGSSREHAPWALRDFGIRCIISTSFADIFFNNCFKNGMLPVILPRDKVDLLMADAEAGKQISIDLEKQLVTRADGSSISFDIDPFRKLCLIEGLDDIGLTMQKEERITAFETKRAQAQPWFDSSSQPAPKRVLQQA